MATTTEITATTTEMTVVTRTKEDPTGETKGENKLAITNADGATTTTRV